MNHAWFVVVKSQEFMPLFNAPQKACLNPPCDCIVSRLPVPDYYCLC